MDFEWNETKREANLSKQGVDIFVAALIFEGIPSRLKTNGMTMVRFDTSRSVWSTTLAMSSSTPKEMA